MATSRTLTKARPPKAAAKAAPKAKQRPSRVSILPPIKLKPDSKWGRTRLVARAGVRLNRLQRVAAGAYLLKRPEGERMVLYVYSNVTDLVQVLEDRQLPLDLVEVTPGGSITEMLESAEYVLSDVDLIAQFVFKMKKLKWLHLTSPVAKQVIVEWENRKCNHSQEYVQQKSEIEEEIHRIEEELSQLQIQYRETMAQTPPSIEAARKAVQSLTERFIKDINMTLLDPHESVRQCLEAIVIILKKKTHLYSEKQPSVSHGYGISWNEICKMTRRSDFNKLLLNFDSFTEINKQFLQSVREIHMKKLKRRTYQIQLHASPASEMLYHWLDIVVRFSSLMVMREPLPTQIQQALARLSEARKWREQLEDEAHGVSRPRFLVTRTGGFFATLVGEYVLSHIFTRERAVQAEKGKSADSFRSLSSLTVGILGLGEAGQEVARVCSVFGINVWTLVRQLPEPSQAIPLIDRYVTVTQLSALLTECDYIVNLLPSTRSTVDLLSGTILSNCKAQAVLLNFGSADITNPETLRVCMSGNWLSEVVYDSTTTGLKEDDAIGQISGVSVVRHIDLLQHAEGISESFGSIVEECYSESVARPDRVIKFNRGY